MRILLPVLTAFPLTGISQLSTRAPQQHRHEKKVDFNDSIQFYRYVRNKMVRDAKHAVMTSPQYEALNDTLHAVRTRGKNYLTLTIYYDKLLWNVDGLNRQLSAIGYPSIHNNDSRIGVGLSGKKKRRMSDLQLLAIGLKKNQKKDKTKLNSHFMDI